jgi:hypothetical protein
MYNRWHRTLLAWVSNHPTLMQLNANARAHFAIPDSGEYQPHLSLCYDSAVSPRLDHDARLKLAATIKPLEGQVLALTTMELWKTTSLDYTQWYTMDVRR